MDVEVIRVGIKWFIGIIDHNYKIKLNVGGQGNLPIVI